MANWGKIIGNGASLVLGVGLPVAGAYKDFKSGEKSLGKAVVGAGIEYAMGDVVMGVLGGPGMLVAGAVMAGTMGVQMGVQYGRENAKTMGRKTGGMGKIGGGYDDTELGATMRQRQLQQMGGHQGLARQALGGEARRRSASVRY